MALAKLAKLAPDALQVVTVRLSASLLMEVHRWAEKQGVDLASALRQLTSLGQEATTRPDEQLTTAQRNMVEKWSKRVERDLRAGRSPYECCLPIPNPEPVLEVYRNIFANANHQSIFQDVKMKLERGCPYIDRAWAELKDDVPNYVKELMDKLDSLERQFLARKKLYCREIEDGYTNIIHWLLSDTVMQRLQELSSSDTPVDDVEAVRQLIAARYLVAENPQRPWEFVWDA
jgi:hypothetical protein